VIWIYKYSCCIFRHKYSIHHSGRSEEKCRKIHWTYQTLCRTNGQQC